MANEKRVRADFVFGATDAALDDGSSTPALPSTGLVLNLEADTLTGADGTAVTAWGGYTVEGATLRHAATLGGTKAVEFDRDVTSNIALGNLMGTAAAAEVFVALRNKNDGGNNSLWKMDTATNLQHYPFSGNLYETWGRSARIDNVPPGVTLTDWHVYNVSTDANGYVMRTGTTSLTAIHTGAAHATAWGTSQTFGQPAGTAGYEGMVAQILIYNRVLTDAERADVVANLQRHVKAPGTVSTSTLSSPALARLPVIDTSNHAAITLMDVAGGKYEVVHVTGHAAGATTATVVRGREGSTAQAWPSGTSWHQGPTAADFLTNRDRRWLPGPAETPVDEFNDRALDTAWVRVDPGAVTTRQTWTEDADVLSVLQVGGDPAAEIHALVRPIGTAMAVGDAFVTRLALHAPWAQTYVMGGIVVANGAVPTSDVTISLCYTDASGPPLVDTRPGTYAAVGAGTAGYRNSTVELYLRLVYVAADTWRTDTSPDGVTWTLGATLARVLAPTHVGLFNSSWGAAIKGAVSYDFLRRVSGVT